MGMFDRRNGGRNSGQPAIDGAEDGAGEDHAVVQALVTRILSAGLDGIGPLDPARQVAEEALAEAGGDVDAAVRLVARRHLRGGAVGGFATGVGGFVTMPVALPVNVVEFYVQAARMVGAIATLRGHDVDDPQVRAAVGLTLVGADADAVLRRAGMSTGVGRAASSALRGLSPTATLMLNKAFGFRLLRSLGTRVFSRLGSGLPLAGGVLGAAIDGVMMKRIADHALTEFDRTQ